ncbi:MAG: 4-(cytidine 5'-diphospho)-2-C-methyl-D-erythritol kinase [Actinomycetota bacterium]
MKAVGRAKVNLRLSILGRRPDGYHELESVMQSIDLADDVELEPAARSEVSIVWAPGLAGPIPAQPDIVERTLAAVRPPGPERVRVTVTKRIPIGAGLGGASADAAAALLGLERMQWQDPLAPLKTEQIAGQLGADVPFCLRGGLALAKGIGEQLEDLACPRVLWWVVGVPEADLATVSVYRRFDELAGEALERSGTTEGLILALAAGDLQSVAANLSNDLELAAFDLMPELAGLKVGMANSGALAALMTGSGSAIIGLCRDGAHARSVAEQAGGLFPRVVIAAGTPNGAEVEEEPVR